MFKTTEEPLKRASSSVIASVENPVHMQTSSVNQNVDSALMYFTEIALDEVNDLWTENYIPLLQNSLGKSLEDKALTSHIFDEGIPMAYRGKAWTLL